MKKAILIIFSFVIVLHTAAQTIRTGNISFVLPADWKKTEENGIVMLTSPAKETGGFCLITIYNETNSTGSIASDFNAAWKELVAVRLKTNTKPAIEKGETEKGWANQTGSGEFTLQGSKASAILSTFSGYNKAFSMLVILNDPSFQSTLETFYNSIALYPPAGNAVPVNPVPANSLQNYQFTLPPGWKQESNNNEILLRGPDNTSLISMMPLQSFSGNLETEMQTRFWSVFAGWERDRANWDHHIDTRGVSPDGWTYLKTEKGISLTTNNNTIHSYGFVLLADLGGQMAIIVGSYPEATCRLNTRMYTDWIELFQSLHFKNYRAVSTSTLPKDILGQWITGSNSSVVTYTFAANGHYEDASAFSVTQDYSAYRVLEKTTSFVGNGTYTLKGNQLVLKNNKGVVQNCLVRIYEEREYSDNWLRHIGLLRKSITDGKLFELTMVYQPVK